LPNLYNQKYIKKLIFFSKVHLGNFSVKGFNETLIVHFIYMWRRVLILMKTIFMLRDKCEVSGDSRVLF